MNWKHVTTLLLKKILILKTMKTSNKILIGFAAALILIPILGMVYTSRVYYKDSKDVKDVAYHNNTFKSPAQNLLSTPISTSFNAVNVQDAKGYFLNIRLVEDKDYGVKVQGDLKNTFTFNVDANGTLQISAADKKDDGNSYGLIIIYAPKINNLSVAKADGVELRANQDSLNFNVAKSGRVNFSSDMQVNSLYVNATDVELINIDKDIKNATFNLAKTPFYSSFASFDNINILSDSEIELIGSDKEKAKYGIKNLVINTKGDANFKVENMAIDKCSGSFSDQTKVQMPAVNLNQMFKEK